MLLFLANPNSFHLSAWERIYARLGFYTIDLATIHRAQYSTVRYQNVITAANCSKFASYLSLGLKLRGSKVPWVHAHGASGYGLSALVSGKPYVLTVYGSEVLANHGYIYRSMVRRILRGASAITVTAAATRDVLVHNFGIRSTNIHLFHTGIDTHQLDEMSNGIQRRDDTDNPIVFSMRNAAPHYRTHQIIESSAELVREGRHLTLVVPLGNGDPGYFEKLKADYPFSWITYIPRRLEQQEMIHWMKISHVCVSYPVTDQLSTTILESLYLSRATVAGWVEAYADLALQLSGSRSIRFVTGSTLASTLRLALDEPCDLSAKNIIKMNYGLDTAARHQLKIVEVFGD